MVAVLEHGRDVVADARHAPRADRLDAGLLDGIEHGAGGLALGSEPPVHRRVVAGEAQGHGIGMAAHDCDVVTVELARRLGQARLVGREHRPVRREADLEVGLPCDRPQAARDRALQRLRRGFSLVAGLAVGDGHCEPEVSFSPAR
jgi:hypothetical protein